MYWPRSPSSSGITVVEPDRMRSPREERALLRQVVAEMIGRVPGRVDGDERRRRRPRRASPSRRSAMSSGRSASFTIILATGRPGKRSRRWATPPRWSRWRWVRMTRSGRAPAALARGSARTAGHSPSTPAPVSMRIGIAAADEVGVGARARHHPRIEAEHAADEIARRGRRRKVRVDPAHVAPPSGDAEVAALDVLVRLEPGGRALVDDLPLAHDVDAVGDPRGPGDSSARRAGSTAARP